jgi:hypothetical protein
LVVTLNHLRELDLFHSSFFEINLIIGMPPNERIQVAATCSQFHVVYCADVSAYHIILGVQSHGETVDGWFRQLEDWLGGDRLNWDILVDLFND